MFMDIIFQILNAALLIAIPVVIYIVVKNHKTRKTVIDNRISNLEHKVNELENKQ